MGGETYRITTLGCRVNRADSLAIERELLERGCIPAAEGRDPGLWVVNTCAVTAEGMRKSRKAVGKCLRSGARVVVTGCAVDLDREAFEGRDGLLTVVANERKRDLVGDLCGPRTCRAPADWIPRDLVRVPVKVQDGCERYCTYCVVPYLRGGPTSRTTDEVVREVLELKEAGAGEVVVCGIDLGSYRDPVTGAGYVRLLESVLEAAGPTWVRLSSLEISDIDDSLLSLLHCDNSLARYLHIPLQSGDEGVLAAMGRSYHPRDFKERLDEIREAVPGIGISSDVMVGFPTEDDGAFENTRRLLEELAFMRVHVFRYSPRPRTAALRLGDPVDGKVKEDRASTLRQLAGRTAKRFNETYVGRIIPVLIEGKLEGREKGLFGRTEGFAGVFTAGDERLVGSVVRLEAQTAESDGVRGIIRPPSGRG